MQFAEVLAITIIFIVTFALTYVVKWYFGNYLPGPFGLPLVGYFPFLGKEPHKKLRDLSKRYGNIFSLNIASANYIIVSDYETAKGILNHPYTFARPESFLQVFPGGGGFAGMRGKDWNVERKFCIQKIRTLGFRKGVWESMIQDDANDFVQEIRTLKGQPHNFGKSVTRFVCFTNMAFLIGRKFEKKELNNEAKVVQDTVAIIMKYIGITALSATVPKAVVKLLYILNIGMYRHIIDTGTAFEDILRKEVDRRLKSNGPTKEDFIGFYLEELRGSKNDKNRTLSIDNLIADLEVLFLAATDTTLSSILWLLLIVASYPHVQKKIQKEIDELIGKNRQIYWTDRRVLPYTMAAIWEMERWVAINPLFPPREAMETFEFKGHTILKGRIIVCNSWAMSHDPNYHKDPEEYRPERFLTDDGKHILQLKSNIPFSMGKRDCPGKMIAMMTIFLYIATLLQHFDITTADGEPADFEAVFGVVAHPKPQFLRFTER